MLKVEKTRFSPLDLGPDGSLDYIYHKHSWYELVGYHQTQLVIRCMNLDANCWSLLQVFLAQLSLNSLPLNSRWMNGPLTAFGNFFAVRSHTQRLARIRCHNGWSTHKPPARRLVRHAESTDQM